MTIDKGVFTWSGIPTGPGYSVFYATPNMGVAADLKLFFETIKGFIPTGVQIDCPTEGDQLDETTGTLTGVWTGGPGGSVVCNGAAQRAGGVGAVITWQTAGIVNGRKVRGRTFLVPLFTDAYDVNGTLLETVRSTIQGAVDLLVADTAGDLLVWHRPVGGVGGSAHAVVSGRVSDTVAVLRSRRR